jgi:hypothetical protein
MTPTGANSSLRLGRYLIGFALIWGVLYASGAAQGGGGRFSGATATP